MHPMVGAYDRGLEVRDDVMDMSKYDLFLTGVGLSWIESQTRSRVSP
jgi:hypothetical protein